MTHPSDIMNAESSKRLASLIEQSKTNQSPKKEKDFVSFGDFLKSKKAKQMKAEFKIDDPFEIDTNDPWAHIEFEREFRAEEWLELLLKTNQEESEECQS